MRKSMLEKMSGMIPYEKFKTMSAPSLEPVKKKFLKRVKLKATQKDLNALANVLNDIVTSQKFESEKISSKILSHLDTSIENPTLSSNFKVNSVKLGKAWQSYYNFIGQYKNTCDELEALQDYGASSQIASMDKVLLKRALSIQGKLNKLSGESFEAFLQSILPLIKINEDGMIDDVVDSLIDQLSQTKKIKTQGSQTNTINFKIGEEDVAITSQGKVDVSLVGGSPFLPEDLFISAKNYSILRNIHLLSKGSAVGLISQWWESSPKKEQYYQNVLSLYNPEEKLKEVRKLFGIQALVGRGDKDTQLANVFIINIRSNKRPIRVISMKALLSDISQKEEWDNAFLTKINNIPLYSESHPRKKENFNKDIKTITVDSSLNKEYLKIAYLQKLTN